jgi:hypothetical protein
MVEVLAVRKKSKPTNATKHDADTYNKNVEFGMDHWDLRLNDQ